MTGFSAPEFMPEPAFAPGAEHDLEFDGIVALAATLCDAPVAFMGVHAEDLFSLQAAVGPLPPGLAEARLADALAGTEGEVRELHESVSPDGGEDLRFFAGVSLFDAAGRRLGLLCVADHASRRLAPAQSRALQSLARQVGALLEPRIAAGPDELTARQVALAARRRAEAEQRRRARLFAATADLAQEAMALIDPGSGRFVEFNSAAHRSLGYDRAEFSALRLTDIEVGLSPEGLRSTYARLLAGDMRTFGTRHRQRDGSLRDVTVTRRVIEIEGNRYVCAVWSAGGMAAEPRIGSLEEVLGDLDVLNATIAHDLRSPLHRIAGFAGLLSYEDEVAGDPVLLDYTARITTAAQKMERLISRLVEYMRLGRVVPARRETGLDGMVAEHIANSATLPGGAGAKWIVKPLPAVWADPGLLHVVVENLIDNAVKFSSKRTPPEISIEPLQTPDGSGFSIRDNGAGFNMEYAEKLMRVGGRLHPEIDFPGTGIGLAIVRRVLEKHHGRIWFEAELARGAVFHVCLPRRKEASGAT